MGAPCSGRRLHVRPGDRHGRQQKQPYQCADDPRAGFGTAANRYAYRYQDAHCHPYAHADAHCHENAYVNADAHPDRADTHGHNDG